MIERSRGLIIELNASAGPRVCLWRRTFRFRRPEDFLDGDGAAAAAAAAAAEAGCGWQLQKSSGPWQRIKSEL